MVKKRTDEKDKKNKKNMKNKLIWSFHLNDHLINNNNFIKIVQYVVIEIGGRLAKLSQLLLP